MATDSVVTPQLVMLAKQSIILLKEGRWEQARELMREVIKQLEVNETRAILQKRPLRG